MKILNLYAGIGGNRKLWSDDHDITAVELDESVAAIYRDLFPNDIVIVDDAHQYLLDHYSEYDFIWSSNPCPSHSKARFWGFGSGKIKPIYPDMSLYQTILFLRHYFKGKWVVENVDPFYTPLDPHYKKLGRHLFWSNFPIGNIETQKDNVNRGTIESWQNIKGFDISKYKLNQRRDKILRNAVDPELGLYILDCAEGIIRKQNVNQMEIFE